MRHVHVNEVRPGHPRHRGLPAVLSAVAVVTIGGCGTMSPGQDHQSAVPAAVTAPTSSALSTPAYTPPSVPAGAGSPAASVAPADATTDPVAAVGAVSGTWTGTLVEPPTAIDPLSSIPYRTDKEVTFDATVTLGSCTVGAACGTLQRRTAVWPPTGQPFACTFDLTFRGFRPGSAALSFVATPVASQSRDCAPVKLVVTSLSSGDAVAVEEEIENAGTFDHGLLVRSGAP